MYTYIHQKTNFIVCDRCEHQKTTYLFTQIYFGTVFLRHCMCVCEKYMLKICNKKIVKTNHGNNMKT